jgi:hypothetical protein
MATLDSRLIVPLGSALAPLALAGYAGGREACALLSQDADCMLVLVGECSLSAPSFILDPSTCTPLCQHGDANGHDREATVPQAVIAVRSIHAMADGDRADFDLLFHPHAIHRSKQPKRS